MAHRPILPVVGIGASAGGVEALAGLFKPMPSDTGMAFVIVMHMPRSHESTMPEILRRFTTMPVAMASEGAAIEANHVYVCPGDHVTTMSNNRLHLEIRSSNFQAKPIDVFLSSLATDRGEEAVGIILSGAGSDGALGLKAIKERGGLTMVQGSDGSAPQQSGMPDSAIATGVVDLVVHVEGMAERLVEFCEAEREFEAGEDDEIHAEDATAARKEIYPILHNQVGHDFSGYKEKTFLRRVRRRLQITQVQTLSEYVERLRQDPEEVTMLFRDLLIGVTNFFRDKDAFQALQELVVPRLFEKLDGNDTVRVWVPGCATGEEVYSIGILLREHLNTLRDAPKVQIFATDIDDKALQVARGGRYPQALLDTVPPPLLERYFTKDDASYVISKEVRDLCIFSPHSVIRDPPFSRIDLISCRNLLIYLGPEFQGRVIPVFHFALRPGGYLFLGTSENISQHTELFQRVDRKHRLFQRRDNVVTPIQFPVFGAGPRNRGAADIESDRNAPRQTAAGLRRTVETRVVDHFAPAHVVVNREGDVVYYSARTGKYLEPAAGMPSRQLVALARRGLRPELRMALQQAMETRRTTSREGVRVEFDERVQPVTVIVEPLGDHDADPLFLVLFQDAGPLQPAEALVSSGVEHSTEHLEQELRDTRERLQATIEEYETALEELKAANEEMVSVNEELQSTNEELETSKEELQSVNEELQTVNLELNGKIDELDHANADLRNLFESTRIASVFLDRQMVIRSFTPAATTIFNLISTDRGRPLTDIVSGVELGDLKRDISVVLDSGQLIERNVRRGDGRAHYMMRLLPYLGRHDVIEGVIVTFFEVTKIVEGEAQQRALVEEMNHRVRNMLTVVHAVATQTINRSAALQDFSDVFLGRIQSMAKSYTLLAREKWAPVPLRDILDTELEQYQTGEKGRVTLAGPYIAFAPQVAVGLGLVFHELATNAAKYGGLAKDEGRLAVQWEIENGKAGEHVLVIDWKESKGLAVKAPQRKGFGTELIDREVKGTLQGSISRDFAASGLQIKITLPVDGRAQLSVAAK